MRKNICSTSTRHLVRGLPSQSCQNQFCWKKKDPPVETIKTNRNTPSTQQQAPCSIASDQSVSSSPYSCHNKSTAMRVSFVSEQIPCLLELMLPDRYTRILPFL